MMDSIEGTSSIGESMNSVTTVRREVIKLRREIEDTSDPEVRSRKEETIIKLYLQRMKWEIQECKTEGWETLECGRTIEEAERDYDEFKYRFKAIRKPKVTTEANLEADLSHSTTILVDNAVVGTVHDGNLKDSLAHYNAEAYKDHSEDLGALDVDVAEYVNIGWVDNDSDDSMTPDKIRGRVDGRNR